MSQKTRMIEESIRKGQAHFSGCGALVVGTGKFTGRATKERFIVRRPETESTVFWGSSNVPVDHELSTRFFRALEERINSQPDVYSFRGSVGGHPLEVRSLSPWHIAFAENMFRDEMPAFLKGLRAGAEIRIFHDPFGRLSDLGLEGQSETMIILDPVELRIGIVGTAYAGEIKKSAFSLCNFALPDSGILPMHASANCLPDGTGTCVLFGLSGTGKTTLSASPDRHLIGDDEILWTKSGISNLENGCYAKLIDLTERREPEIYRAVNRFGSIMENVTMDPETREVDFTSRKATENTRGSYPLTAFERVFDQGREAGAPESVVFLAADAFGVLPPVAKLDLWQAQYHFVSGYTAKVAGTEIGVKEPKAVFSTCFGEPFMPRNPGVYAKLLAECIQRNQTSVWLLNTGWTGGGYGKGERFPLAVSRRILAAIQSGELDDARMVEHPIFGFQVPAAIPGVDPSLLRMPEGPEVERIAGMFNKNMERFAGMIDPEIIERGGPRISTTVEIERADAA